jgi:hypothetical protein
MFHNNGTDTNDHTSIFAWADHVICEGCTFRNDTQYATVGRTGGNTAYEIHGTDHRFIGNHVKNYFRGVWVGPNFTSAVENSYIANNTFETMFYGVDFFRYTSSQTISRNTVIAGNAFSFNAEVYGGCPDQKAALSIACPYAVADIVFAGNVLRSTDTGSAAGTAMAVIAPGRVAANTFRNITIENNRQFGGTNGVYVITNATNGLGDLRVEDNAFTDLSNAAVSTMPVGILINAVSAISALSIDGNTCTDSRGGRAQCDYGIYLQGTVTTLHVGTNRAVGMARANYLENAFTATNR